MLKRLFLAIAIAVPAILSAQNIKIGVIDSDQIISQLPAAKTAETQLADISKKYEADYAKLMEEYQRKVEEFQKLEEKELPAIKERKARDIEDTQVRIQQFQQTAREDLQKKQAELFAPIQQQVMNAIESVGKEGSYTIIQERASLLYYSAPAEDITPLVKKKLGI